MTEIPNHKPVYDLEERTFQFAKAVRLFIKELPKTIANIEDGKQNGKNIFINTAKIKIVGLLEFVIPTLFAICCLSFGIYL